MSGRTGTAQWLTTTGGSPFPGNRPAAGDHSAPRFVSDAGPAFHRAARQATHLELGPLTSSAGCARDHTRAVLTSWGIDDEAVESIVLVVSELITNAVQATVALGLTVPRPVGLTLLDEAAAIVAQVTDAAAGQPDVQAPAADIEHGRGLILVNALSLDWGTVQLGAAGKVVWARMPRASRTR
jgi:anti-sigma regulatory factor (Ser/Thr protein kinase)